jgi:hypothetical protein
MSQTDMSGSPYNPYDDGTDPIDRKALLQQMGQGGNHTMGGSYEAGQRDAAQNAPEVAGGAPKAAPSAFKSYMPPAEGDLSGGFMENNRSHVGAASEALSGMATGASMGSVVPGIGTAVGAGVGAIYGGIKGWAANRSNDTKNTREDFAKGMGVNDSSALWSKLGAEVPPEVAQELQGRALNRIGKHDNGANEQWMQDVQAALAAGKPAAAPGLSPSATSSAVAPGAAPGAAPAGPVDSSGWDTDGFSKPAYTAQSFGNAPAGFDQAKWANPNHQTPKYAVGRILAESGAPSVENAAKAAENIMRAYPGATYNGKDKITMPDGGVIDILTNSSTGDASQMGWAWQPETGPGGAALPQDAQGVAGAGGGGGGMESLVSSDPEFFKRLMSQLQGSLNGGPGTVDDSALRQLL